jgi:hypothetical protein
MIFCNQTTTVYLSFYVRHRYQVFASSLRYLFTVLKINFGRPILVLSIKVIKTVCLYGQEK